MSGYTAKEFGELLHRAREKLTPADRNASVLSKYLENTMTVSMPEFMDFIYRTVAKKNASPEQAIEDLKLDIAELRSKQGYWELLRSDILANAVELEAAPKLETRAAQARLMLETSQDHTQGVINCLNAVIEFYTHWKPEHDALHRAPQNPSEDASNLAVTESSVTPNDDDRSFSAMVGLVVDLERPQIEKIARIFATYRCALGRAAESAQKGCTESESG